ncbi:aminotransferase class I/II-fold pyridoxal phosphate-dependent enzyme [Actinoallomurus rhizosphaericola]|uniref:aminotransferase class I/II-fold pyridoxal phosphate-dependent enzyme n=1 Tax=Actinoallomurus rhizosphaericola TaxID=2952536 RepID=UPI002092ADBD|nr:aminotransferase class I/II-fold pyridoxal phosphate-dependent enzyme [Actinoallomurus rhizosphaericola]MCO5999893.1 aminotransferase class I/II-fold pyridoxal phosphate-dependent enzyme [Actinoallomurus rhizosphaericola]
MPADVDLRHHGDTEVGPGLVDLAVNVRPGTPPAWLAALLRDSVAGLAAYPDAARARAAVARRHGRSPEEVLLTAGAAEAFVLLARVLTPRRPVVVHPQFTEPEAALRAAGHVPDRAILTGDFRLRAVPGDTTAREQGPVPEDTVAREHGPVSGEAGAREHGSVSGAAEQGPVSGEAGAAEHGPVPEDADLVMLGNPTNPTSVLHPAAAIAALARPGRTLVVDEAFMDCVPGETESLASRTDVPGLVVIRSLTKTWGLAGLRVGYVLAEPSLIARLADAQPLWSVSTPALVAAEACTSHRALAEADAWARDLAVERDRLAAAIRALGPHVVPGARASFLCVRVPGPPGGLAVRAALRDRGYAVRRGDTFPGLGPDWLRVAVRDASTNDAFTGALKTVLT